MYLKRILPESIISFTSSSGQTQPDFVIETREKPILLEVSTGTKSLCQFKQSKIKYRYSITLSEKAGSIQQQENNINLPLWYFLLL